jgi:hypothetical protein
MHLMKWALLGLMSLAVPTPLARYRSWHELTPKPRLVPYVASAACMAPSTPITNPHEDRWIRVYANPVALEAMQAQSGFPPGSIVAKEKLLRADGKPEGVAFMIKHGKGSFIKSGGWEFRFYPSDGAPLADERCGACHRAGGGRDYVFAKLETEH